MTNPENNWVHVSIKGVDGTILDARAEDGDTLAALIDGSLGAGTYQGYVSNVFPTRAAGTDPVLQQAVTNVQQGQLAPPSLPAPTPPTVPPPPPGAAPQGQWQQSGQPDKIELGEVHGFKLTLHTKGQFGKPYVNAYNGSTKQKANVNLPDGLPTEAVDVNKAWEIAYSKLFPAA